MSDAVARARTFAVAAHGAQRYGEHPYSHHLDAVAALLVPYGEEAQIVGYLHDVLEDTSIPAADMERDFGPRVTALVAQVTDETGANRKERKARTNAKLAGVSAEMSVVLIVKAADRLANLRESARGGAGSKLEMYRGEHAAFRCAAYRLGLCEELWAEMEGILKAAGRP
jgi:(p)ppGpp synthase/HD superfamily hydrolase